MAKNPKIKQAPESRSILDSANEIWLAGLAAFTQAQREGGKTFDKLVKEGEKIQGQSKELAQGTAEEILSKTTATWGKLEQAFEQRVSKTLEQLGVPTNKDVQKLGKRIDALDKRIKELAKGD